jgi:segregation and condensation protein B
MSSLAEIGTGVARCGMAGPDIPREILRLTEALVFASPEPVTWKTLRPLLPDHLDPTDVLEALKQHCADRGVVLVESGGGWAFRTAPDLAPALRPALSETRRLPRVAMETLVVIALHQPVTRAEIEELRGVALSQPTVDVLLETGMIRPWGRRETQGRPTLWVTTDRFLAQFGLRSLRDLPGAHLFASWRDHVRAAAPEAGEAPRTDGLGAGRGDDVSGP